MDIKMALRRYIFILTNCIGNYFCVKSGVKSGITNFSKGILFSNLVYCWLLQLVPLPNVWPFHTFKWEKQPSLNIWALPIIVCEITSYKKQKELGVNQTFWNCSQILSKVKKMSWDFLRLSNVLSHKKKSQLLTKCSLTWSHYFERALTQFFFIKKFHE